MSECPKDADETMSDENKWFYSPMVDTMSDRWMPCITVGGVDTGQDRLEIICGFDTEFAPSPEHINKILAAVALVDELARGPCQVLVTPENRPNCGCVRCRARRIVEGR